MRDDRLEIGVTFDSARGYIASAPELRAPVVALSLGGLRRRIEALLLPDDPIIVLQLDALAERERHRRLSAPAASSGASAICQHGLRPAVLIREPAAPQAHS
jgi:hypothetical protein